MLREKEKKGFTIIELVIAVFILSAAVIGVFSSFSVMVILTADASDRLTAAYLAQEGMEIVRNIRDANWLNMGDDPYDPVLAWDNGLTGCREGCIADYQTAGTAISPLAPYAGSYLYTNSDDFYSNNITGVKTKFKRKITINPVKDSDGFSYIIKVSVRVEWDQKPTVLNPDGDPGVIEVEENLYDWY